MADHEPEERPDTPRTVRSVHVSGDVTGGVIVAGDNATIVVEASTGSPDSYVIDPTPILTRVDDRHHAYRPSIVHRIDDFMAHQTCGYVIVEGDAGMGKSTILASLARGRGYAAHFVELMNDPSDSDAALRNLAAQLIERHGLHDEFAPSGTLVPTAPGILLNDVMAAVTRGSGDPSHVGSPVVLIVDALDVAVTQPGQNPLGLPRLLPRGVFIVASMRPGSATIVTSSPRTVVTLDASSPDNLDDLRGHVDDLSRQEPLSTILRDRDVDIERFCRSVVDGADGVWIIAHHLLDEVGSGRRDPLDLDAPLPGLWHFYRSSIVPALRREPADLPVLAVVCGAAAPVSIRFIAAVIDPSDDGNARVEQIVDRWQAFLTPVRGRETRYLPYHRSFRDFLAGIDVPDDIDAADRELTQRMAAALAAAHSTIADRYLTSWGGLEADLHLASDPQVAMLDDGYGLRHLINHLCDAGRFHDAEQLIWMEAGRGAGSVWWSLKARHLGLSAYRRDIGRMIDAAPDAADGGHCVRLALVWILVSLSSYVARLPAAALPRLVERGLLGLDEAWANIELLPDAEQRAEALIHLATVAGADRAPDVEAAVVRALGHIEDDYWRLSEIVRFDRVRRHTPADGVRVLIDGLTPSNRDLARRLRPATAGDGHVESPTAANRPEFVEAYLQRRQFAESVILGWERARHDDDVALAPTAAPDWVWLTRRRPQSDADADPGAIPIGDHRDALWACFGRAIPLPTGATNNVADRLSPTGVAIWKVSALAAGPDEADATPVASLLESLAERERRIVLDAVSSDLATLPVGAVRTLVGTLTDAHRRRAVWTAICTLSDDQHGVNDWDDIRAGFEGSSAAEQAMLMTQVVGRAPRGALADVVQAADTAGAELPTSLLRAATARRAAELGEQDAAAHLLAATGPAFRPLVEDALARGDAAAARHPAPHGASGAGQADPVRADPDLPVWAQASELSAVAAGMSPAAFDESWGRIRRAADGAADDERDHALVELAHCLVRRRELGPAIDLVASIASPDLGARCLISVIRAAGGPAGADDRFTVALESLRSAAARGRVAAAAADAISRSDQGSATSAFDVRMHQALIEMTQWKRTDLSAMMPVLVSCLARDARSARHLPELALRVACVYDWWW